MTRGATKVPTAEWSSLAGQHFYKMSGSGNDFIFLDGRSGATAHLETPAVIARLCARGTGIGADGIVVMDDAPSEKAAGLDSVGATGGQPSLLAATANDHGRQADVVIRYYNADGSRASLCGNATLCTASLAVQLGMVDPSGFGIGTDAGVLAADVRDGVPGFELPPVTDANDNFRQVARTGEEQRLGFATAGVPHVVIQVPDLESCDVVARGRAVRQDQALPVGANVNFVAPSTGRPGCWRIRTYERGVESETLACGTGSAASAILLRLWGLADGEVALETRSGQVLTVSCRADEAPRPHGQPPAWIPSLRGEGRLVYRGELGSV